MRLLSLTPFALSISFTTAKVVQYAFELTTGSIAPDGYERKAILVNGQTPGPT
ncbi:hypothetical protein FRB90_005005, partial [Tulasnella sp. 427]